MEFPRSADEYFHQAEIGRNLVQANFSRLNIFIRQK